MSTEHESVYHGAAARQLVQRMGEAAENYLAALSTDQRARAILPFADHATRTEWHYTPHPRPGIPFTEMDRQQQRLAQRLIATGLSRAGFVTVSTIMGLETALDVIEEWSTELWWRDSRLYHLILFGTPVESGSWGWRFEGHHVSLNYTIVDGRIASPTPSFFGSNPARSPLGPAHWLRPLAGSEDLARELVTSLGSEERNQVLVTELAPPDIVSLNRPAVVDNMLPIRTPELTDAQGVAEMFPTMERLMQDTGTNAEQLEAVRYTTRPKGLAVAAMTAAQRELVRALVGEYIQRMPDELAELELARLEQDGIERIHFVWAGSTDVGEPHYYRLQGPRFLVEYDNIQNDANHIHSVWRDPTNDFGGDPLAAHYRHDH